MTAKYTEKKKASNRAWDSKNIDRISIVTPKGKADVIKAHAAAYGDKSVNAFINRAIDEAMERDRREKE